MYGMLDNTAKDNPASMSGTRTIKNLVQYTFDVRRGELRIVQYASPSRLIIGKAKRKAIEVIKKALNMYTTKKTAVLNFGSCKPKSIEVTLERKVKTKNNITRR